MTIKARFRFKRTDFSLHVDTEIPSSGISALFGPSGCGKTSLLRAIAGLDFHPDGYLKVNETVWQDGDRFLAPHRRPLGYVFQEASLFDHLSVRGNLEYGVKRTPSNRRRIALDEAIDLLEIAPLLERSPSGLSGGERQRVAIARALAVSPELLLMDEPLAAVDSGRKQEIIPYLESLHRELVIPVLYVSHQLDEVSRLADHIIMLQSGRIAATGDVHDLFTRLDLPAANDDEAASIIEAVVSSHDAAYELTHLDFPGGKITMTRLDLPGGSPVRLRLAARDVSLTLERQSGTSILNILPVTVDSMKTLKNAQVNVRLMAGGVPLLARITRKSCEELGLEKGKPLFAQIKSIALLA
ncbi:MAG: molybdenum ABC transporter ATP-binding protein [Xanthomonadales bacterium]|nr:molybdenum ABC transporter ATP-binding protein [Gammaproteobacteria bacterium]MBT8052690.1 molybdenum ABC transporter ATP-binding protein [Gammaproteobacteria bacterium]NND56789.1 molybdenum ABC transporter ATP-binding protein [Xanthomonadales bacterium]NNK50652.1 molybdenum ABC transporter ATP-binding protein [Xanthomonadales bacterium]